MSALDEIVKNHPKIAEELVELRRDNLYLLSENNRLIFNNGKLSTEISDLRSTIKQLSNIRSDNILLLKQVDVAIALTIGFQNKLLGTKQVEK